ncbi:MAG: hypothetical protein ACI9YL_001146 [Luteibaculaceae bacterium]|jgi:hypothetical protein
MKTKLFIVLAGLSLAFSSCIAIVEEVHYGPDGRDGDAYFGIDYVYEPPLAYWDENLSIPDNPRIGDYYYSYPGTFYFEYFLDEDDYWYGEYSIFIEFGSAGMENGRPGYDGRDTHLMMVFDPDFGPREYRKGNFNNLPYQVKELENGQLELTPKDGSKSWKIVAQKTTTKERASRK